MHSLPASPTIADFRDLVRSGIATVPDLIDTLLARIAVNAPEEVFISRVDAEIVKHRAAQLQDRLLSEPGVHDRMPLLGVPFAVKDNIDTMGVATTCGCPAFAYNPCQPATVVERLEAAGAILVGKTNLDQFATGLVGTRSPYGEVRNPFNAEYVSGGSSSGSAAAVALGLVPFALGTDTAGSGRVPAGFCNLVGIKPTPGLVSTHGVFPACRSLDCVSVFAHTVADGWQVLSLLAGADPEDVYSHHIDALPPLVRKIRFGVPRPLEFFGDTQAEQAFAAALAALKEHADFEFVEVPYAPFVDVARLLYDGPWVAERRLAIGRFFDDHGHHLDPVVREVIAQADGKTALDAFEAMHQLESGKRMAQAVFAKIDILLVPTSPTIHTRATIASAPIPRNSDFGYYTNFVNLLGLCALAMPGPFRRDGLPAGVTLIAPAGGDHRLAELARRLEPRLHARLGLGIVPPPRKTSPLGPLPDAQPGVRVAVVGAHLSGMPLNWQLVERQARQVCATRTAPIYRLFALPDSTPPKPGLLKVGHGGSTIELELWEMPLTQYGSFVAGIPAPLGIGTLELEDGSTVQGFLCEAAATEGAEDISQYGGWRAYCAAARIWTP
jgi:allophanate hydrolase